MRHVDLIECEDAEHEFAYEPDEDPDDGPATCMHCGAGDPNWPPKIGRKIGNPESSL